MKTIVELLGLLIGVLAGALVGLVTLYLLGSQQGAVLIAVMLAGIVGTLLSFRK